MENVAFVPGFCALLAYASAGAAQQPAFTPFHANGIYQTGGRVADGAMTNRLAVTKTVTVQSVNGPGETVIAGNQATGGGVGDDAVRCALLSGGATLSGFTLTNGATRGDVYPFLDQQGAAALSPDGSGVLSNCVLTGSIGNIGGGAVLCTLNNCTLTGNLSLNWGGGAVNCTLNQCTVTGNSAGEGGGAYVSTLTDCMVSGNSAGNGGGASASTLNGCSLIGNIASNAGGGANGSTLNNCTVTGNTANTGQGGPNSGIQNYSTGGGANSCALNNCIVFYNRALNGPNYSSDSILNYCCATPLATNGTGNLVSEPQLADGAHLTAGSPCRGAGSPAYATGTDIDGEPWANPPTIGCDEFYAGPVTGPLNLAIQADYMNVAVRFAVNFSGTITGRATSNRWDFGDGTTLSNQLYSAHNWTEPGDYAVVFTAFNDSNPGGVDVTQIVHVVQGFYFVALGNLSPAPPYDSWVTAATNIQDAVDAAAVGGTVIVSNGVYQTGGRVVYNLLTNRVAITKPIVVQSVNGPSVTSIKGNPTLDANAVRCAYVTNGATLTGFTLTNGSTLMIQSENYDNGVYRGGGVWGESASATVSNCIITQCLASDSGGGSSGGTLFNCMFVSNNVSNGYGGGGESSTVYNSEFIGNIASYGGAAYGGALYNCLLVENSATGGGGGFNGSLINCTCVSNTATWEGGGAVGCSLNNCILYYNTALSDSNYWVSGLNYCCTTPLPDSGPGNLTNEPAFVDLAGGDFHLQAGSPCINAGNNTYVSGAADLDGNPRITGITVDIGAYEYPIPVAMAADYTNVAVGFTVNLNWQVIAGNVSQLLLEFADGTVLTNPPGSSMAHAWAAPGDYAVTLTAFSDIYPTGVSSTVVVHVVAGNYFVSLASANPVAPFTSWGTAATNIQDAVDAAFVGGTIWVSNGVYQTGMETVDGSTTNRITVTNQLSLRSANGPAVTVIDGGDAFRCVYLAGNVSLDGFTLMNGYSSDNGGAVLCDSTNPVVSNCMMISNTAAANGGAAYLGRLDRCSLFDNSAAAGGGANASLLTGCALTANSAGNGGAVESCMLNHCTLTGNSASVGGGADNSTLNNCIVYYNDAPGVTNFSGSTLNFCCTTPLPDAGTNNITAEPLLADFLHLGAGSPCLGAGNGNDTSGLDIDGELWATPPAIGCDELHPGSITGALSAAVVATTYVRTGQVDNLTAVVQGHAALSFWDFGDGAVVSNHPYVSHQWAVAGNYPVVLRAYNDSNPGGISTTTTVQVVTQLVYYVDAACTNARAPYLTWATAATNIQAAVDTALFPGSLVMVTNGIYGPSAIDQPQIVRSVNGPSVTVINGGKTVRCATLVDGAVLSGFTLTNGASGIGGGVYCPTANSVLFNCVLVGNSVTGNGGGAYGGTLNSCVISNNSAGYGGGGAFAATVNNCVVSSNNASREGGGADGSALNNCILTANYGQSGGGASYSTLNSCILSNNSATFGGGTWYSTLNNCTVTANSSGDGAGTYGGVLNQCVLIKNVGAGSGGAAIFGTLTNCQVIRNSTYYGAGVYGCTAVNCAIIGNSGAYGGGSYYGMFYNCTIVSNSASGSGGGLYFGIATNSVIYYNVCPNGPNYFGGSLGNCCSTPLSDGAGNFTNAPVFLNQAGGDLRLLSNSPCINSGNNAFVVGANDLDGNPRIAGVVVDVGAYEFQNPASVISYAWLQQYGLPTDGSADFTDPDGDGLNNWQEWIAGTDPTNALSVLKMASAARTNNPPGLLVTWQSVSGINYFLQSSANLGAQPAFSIIQSNIIGQAGTTSYTDTTATNSGPYFYRVGVQ